MQQMRRKDRKISDEETTIILNQCEYGTLSMITPENTPYAVPLNYVYISEESAIYFHCAKVGQKITCIQNNPNVFFNVVQNAKIIDGEFTTHYESAMAEGTATLLSDIEDIKRVLLEICKKCYPKSAVDLSILEESEQYIQKFLAHTAVVKINVTSISGKANRG